MERAGSILQANSHLNVRNTPQQRSSFFSRAAQTTDIFDRFLHAQSMGDERCLDILRPLGLRYFSPSELLRLFDFTPLQTDISFHWPEGTSLKTKYRLIGNSVNVKVVQELINYLFEL